MRIRTVHEKLSRFAVDSTKIVQKNATTVKAVMAAENEFGNRLRKILKHFVSPDWNERG